MSELIFFEDVSERKPCQNRPKLCFPSWRLGKGYLAPDLHTIFDEWYNRKLKTSIYPQYKDVAVAKREAIKATPKGNAYDELQEMGRIERGKSCYPEGS